MAASLRWAGASVAAGFVWLVAASLGLCAILELWEALASVPAWAIPLQWLFFARDYRGYHGVNEALLLSGGAATLLAGACLATFVRRGEGQPLHGRSWWLTRWGAMRGGFSLTIRPKPDALLLGVLGRWPFRLFVGLPGEEHAALTARTRSGKGVSFVVPNALNWGGSLVCFSVKRDVFEAAAAERAAKGDAVFVFDLSDPSRRTHRWNPLGHVRRGGDPGTFGDVQRVMFFLVPETKANNPFWDNAARKLAVAVAVCIAETPGAKLNVSEVLAAVRRPDWAEHLTRLVHDARARGRPLPEASASVVLGFVARAGQQAADDVRETMTTALALWNDPLVAAATEESDFDLAALRSDRMSVFVCGGPADLRIYRPIYGLLFQLLVQLNTRVEFGRDPSHRHRALGLLDEFWALGKADVLADSAAFTASFGFRWSYVQQTKDQSVTAFGEAGARNLFNNTGAEIVFGGTDIQTAKEVSERMGHDTVTDTSRSRPRFMGWINPARQTESDAARGRALALPQEISRLPKTAAIVLRPGLMPLRLRRIEWFREPWFKRLAGPAPAVPALQVCVERDAAAVP